MLNENNIRDVFQSKSDHQIVEVHLDEVNDYSDYLYVRARVTSKTIDGRRVYSAEITSWTLGEDRADSKRAASTLDPAIAGFVVDYLTR